METSLETIKKIGLQILPSSVIFLFGSRARIDFSEDSDYDLLFVTENQLSTELKRTYQAQLRRLLAKQKIPVDILIESKNEVEIKKGIIGHIVKQALSEGVRL